MNDNYIEFTNGSRIDCIESNDTVRSNSSKQIFYYSEYYKKYHTIKGIWKWCNEFGLTWYQKVYMVVWSKWLDLKDRYTNPYVKALRRYFR